MGQQNFHTDADKADTLWYPRDMGIYDTTLNGIRREIATRYKSVREFARIADVNSTMITRWLAGQRVPDFGKLGEVLDVLGAEIHFEPQVRGSNECHYKPTSFDIELREYLNGMISLQKKKADAVAQKAAPDNSETARRILSFLSGQGPLWASDLPLVAAVINQQPEEIVKTVSEMVASAEYEVKIQQTLAG